MRNMWLQTSPVQNRAIANYIMAIVKSCQIKLLNLTKLDLHFQDLHIAKIYPLVTKKCDFKNFVG